MKSPFIVFICSLIICSCNSNKSKNNKDTNYQKPEYKTLTVIRTNMNDSVIMHTDDGHILSYSTDSAGNHIVNFAKFNYNAGGYERIRDILVRVELDTSMQYIKSIVSVHGVALCFEEEGMYNVIYYDKHMHQKELNYIAKNIIKQLINAYDISLYISANNEDGWYSICSSLEPVCVLSNFDYIEQDEVYNQKVKDRLPRIINAAERLTHFCNALDREQKKRGKIRW